MMARTGFQSPENAQGMYHLDEERARQIGKLTSPPLMTEQVLKYACGEWSEGQAHQDWLDNAPDQEIADWISDGLAGLDQDEIAQAVGPA